MKYHYGHAEGEIMVAVDLCTREAMLWFLPNRKQDNVARALLTGLIFQKGVPLTFRNDEAAELVEGTVAAMNSYLGTQQITTGGHNPRSNAVVERFMQHLTACLTKCDDRQYSDMRDYLPAIALPTSQRSIRPSTARLSRLGTDSEPGRSRKHAPTPGCR